MHYHLFPIHNFHHSQPIDSLFGLSGSLLGALGAFFAVVVALITPYLIEVWKYKFYSAKLVINFSNSPPYCHITKMGGNIPIYYFRFKVSNNGKTQAERCEAVLEKIWEIDNLGKVREWERFSPIPLKWSGPEKEQYFTIQPERTVFVDIGRIYEYSQQFKSVYYTKNNQNKFFFELPNGRPYAQPDCLLPGKYKIQISIYSNNAKKITREFEIDWIGNWDKEESVMLNKWIKIN